MYVSVSASATLQCKRSLHNKVEQHISDDVTITTMIDNVQWYIRLHNNIAVHVSKYTHTRFVQSALEICKVE